MSQAPFRPPSQPRFGMGKQAVLVGIFVMAGIAVATVLAQLDQWKLSENAGQLIDGGLARSLTACRVMHCVAECRQSQRDYRSALEDQAARQKALRTWQVHCRELEGQLQALAEITSNELDRQTVSAWQSILARCRTVFVGVVQRVESRTLTGRDAVYEALRPSQACLEQLAEGAKGFAVDQWTQAEAERAQMREMVARRIRFINVRAILSLLGVALVAVWFHRTVLWRLNEVVAAARRLAAGDREIRLVPGTDDEFGLLARHLNDIAAAARASQLSGQEATTPGQADDERQSSLPGEVSPAAPPARSAASADCADQCSADRGHPEMCASATRPEPPAVRPDRPLPPTEDSPRPRILLAEDGPENRRLMQFVLQKAGAEVIIADNGREAVEQVLAGRSAAAGRPDRGPEPFDLILMDMEMPVMDGCEATRRLRQGGYAGPIVAVTGHAARYDRQTCLDAGCNDYLAKPVDRERLLAMVTKYVALSCRGHRARAGAASS